VHSPQRQNNDPLRYKACGRLLTCQDAPGACANIACADCNDDPAETRIHHYATAICGMP
jgi:hypothetical protein